MTTPIEATDHRGRRLVVLAMTVSLASAACATQEEAGPTAAPPATDACAEGQLPQLQAGSHLLGDTAPPVPYTSTPGTSGWHLSGSFETGLLAEEIDDPYVVAVLEQGGVVAVYDPAVLPADAIDVLEQQATGPFAGRLTVAPYAGELDAPVVLAAWGVLQRCEDVDLDAVATFVITYHGAVEAH